MFESRSNIIEPKRVRSVESSLSVPTSPVLNILALSASAARVDQRDDKGDGGDGLAKVGYLFKRHSWAPEQLSVTGFAKRVASGCDGPIRP